MSTNKENSFETTHTIKITLKDDIKNIFDTFIENSTGHGYPRVYMNFMKKKYFMGTMWSIFFSISLSYCVYTLIESIIDYYSYNVNISISRNQELPATFPAITICNVQLTDERYKRPFNFLVKTSSYGQCFLLRNGNDFQKCVGINISANMAFDQFSVNSRRFMARYQDEFDAIKQIGYYLNDDMLISCEYNGQFCDESNFTRFWDYQYGNCYTFNDGSMSLIQTSATGSQYGLKMELIVSKYIQNL